MVVECAVQCKSPLFVHTLPPAAEQLRPQTDGPIVLAVRIDAHLRRKHQRLQLVLHLAVRVDVAGQHLLSGGAFPALPLDEAGPPVLEDVRLRVLLALALAEAALRAHRGDHVHAEQIDLQVLLEVLRDHVLGAPGAAVVVHFQSAWNGIWDWC